MLNVTVFVPLKGVYAPISVKVLYNCFTDPQASEPVPLPPVRTTFMTSMRRVVSQLRKFPLQAPVEDLVNDFALPLLPPPELLYLAALSNIPKYVFAGSNPPQA